MIDCVRTRQEISKHISIAYHMYWTTYVRICSKIGIIHYAGIQLLHIQWDLFIKDTLGPANLSTVERLSTLQRWRMYQHYRRVYLW